MSVSMSKPLFSTVDEFTALSLWGTSADDGVAGRSMGDRAQNLRDVIGAMRRALETADTHERAVLHHRLGYLTMMVGDARLKSVEAFTMAREEAVAAGNRALEGMILSGLSVALDFVGRRHEALVVAREAVVVAEELGDQLMLAMALNSEAQFYKENGENPRAYAIYERIRQIGEALDNPSLVMAGLMGMGRTLPMTSATEAISIYEEALAMARQINRPGSVALACNNLSDWMIFTGRYAEAITLRQECFEIATQHGLRPLVGRALIGQAKAWTLMGDLDKARELLDKGYPTVVSAGDIEGDLHSALNLAYLFVAGGDVPRGTELYRQTLERSLAAPDHACAIFAQKALELLAEGVRPAPGVLPEVPMTDEVLSNLHLDDEAFEIRTGIRAGARLRGITYPTGDQVWHSGL